MLRLLALALGHWVACEEGECVRKADWEDEEVVEKEREGDWEVVGVLVPRTCTAPAKPGPAGPDTLLQSAPAGQVPEQAEVVRPAVLP